MIHPNCKIPKLYSFFILFFLSGLSFCVGEPIVFQPYLSFGGRQYWRSRTIHNQSANMNYTFNHFSNLNLIAFFSRRFYFLPLHFVFGGRVTLEAEGSSEAEQSWTNVSVIHHPSSTIHHPPSTDPL